MDLAKLVSIIVGLFAIAGTLYKLYSWWKRRHPPFRVSYFILEGYAIDLLLNGKIDEQLEKTLAGQPFIVPNNVLRSVSYLVRTFAEDGSPFTFKLQKGGEPNFLDDQVSARYRSKSFFAGSTDLLDFFTSGKGISGYIHSLEDPAQKWKIIYKDDTDSNVSNPLYQMIFRRSAKHGDLNSFQPSPYRDFYMYITRDYMPPDFGYLDLFLGETECDIPSDDNLTTMAAFRSRQFVFHIAVIENITKEPIKLGEFIFKEISMDRLRSRDDNKALLNAQSLTRQPLFPLEMLNPGEKIIIPLEMQLRSGKNIFDAEAGEHRVDLNNYADVIRKLKKSSRVDFPIAGESWNEPEKVESISSKAIENILSKPKLELSLDKDYVYGPSIRIESLKVNNTKYPFRQFDPSRILLANGDAMGSCPYIYTYSSSTNSWVKEGVILLGRNGKGKESTDEKSLKRFDGRVLIREEDAEDSFINMVYIRAISSNGKETTIYPTNKILRSLGGEYLKLKRGEQLIVDFDLPKDLAASKYILVVQGYYVPYREVTKTSRSLQLMNKKQGRA